MGAYQPDCSEPEHSNATSATLWDLSLLLSHFHPCVRHFSAQFPSLFPSSPPLSPPSTNGPHPFTATTSSSLSLPAPSILFESPFALFKNFDSSSGQLEPNPSLPALHPLQKLRLKQRTKETKRGLLSPFLYFFLIFLSKISSRSSFFYSLQELLFPIQNDSFFVDLFPPHLSSHFR